MYVCMYVNRSCQITYNPCSLLLLWRLTFLTNIYMQVAQVTGTVVTHQPGLEALPVWLRWNVTRKGHLPRKPTNLSSMQTNGDNVIGVYNA